MKSENTLIGIGLTIALLLSTAAPALAVGADEDGLSVGVERGDAVVVTVEREAVADNDTTTVAAENATVTVEALNGSTYAANESFVTDENGTVPLPDPAENVTVVVTATWNGSTAETGEIELVASDAGGDEAAEREFDTFGGRLSAFVHRLLSAGDTDGPLGQLVSQFARENNPGADHRSENAAKGGEEKAEKRNGNAKKNGGEKRDGKAEKAEKDAKKNGKEKGKEKGEKRDDHAKKNGREKGGDEGETETTAREDEETAETTDDTATTD